MTIEEADQTRAQADEIESWIKDNVKGIFAVHLRDCGSKCFYFRQPNDHRMVGLLEIPICPTEIVDPETGKEKQIYPFPFVTYNCEKVIRKEPISEFYTRFKKDPSFIVEYFNDCKKKNLSGTFFKRYEDSQNKSLSLAELRVELKKAIISEIIKSLKSLKRKHNGESF